MGEAVQAHAQGCVPSWAQDLVTKSPTATKLSSAKAGSHPNPKNINPPKSLGLSSSASLGNK